MQKCTLGCLFLFLFCSDTIAQRLDCPFKLQLNVAIDKPQNNTRVPAISAEIFIEKDHRKMLTSNLGKVSFLNLCDTVVEIEIYFNGTHQHLNLIATHKDSKLLGYQIILQDVTYVLLQINKVWNTQDQNNTNNQWNNDDFLSNVTISANMKSIHGDAIRGNELRIAPQQNLAKSLESLPLTQTLSTGMSIGKPVVQGMFGQRLPILNNGFRIEGQTWGLDHAPETDNWGVQQVELLRGTDAMAIAADAWGNAINLVNQFDYHQFNRDFTQMLSYQSNGSGIQMAGKYLKGRNAINHRPHKHPFDQGQYILYSAKITGNYSTPTTRLTNTGCKEGSFSYGNQWNSKRGYWGIPAISNRAFHFKAYAFQGGIFSESHIGNITDLLAAMKRETPLYNAPFTYKIGKPQQQAYQFHASYNNQNLILNKFIIHHKFALQSNQRLEFDPHRSNKTAFAQLNLWQATITQYTGFEKINASKWKKRIVFQNNSQWQRYAGYYFLPNYQQWQPNLHLYFGNKSNPKAQHEFVLRTDWLIRNAFPKINGTTTQTWEHHLGRSAAYSFHRQANNHQLHVHFSQLWRAPSINELYSNGVHHGAAAFEQGNAKLLPESGQKLEFIYAQLTPKNEFRFSGFAQYSSNFIALFPMSSPVITVRGAFPGYEYKQLPTFYSGAEIQFAQMLPTLKTQWSVRAGLIYGKVLPNYAVARFANLLPCPKASIHLQKRFRHGLFNIDIQGVSKQPFYTPATDFLPPPNGYVLVNAQLQLFDIGRSQHSQWVIYGENIGNKKYRDYMDRFRYFTNQAGMNLGLKWILDIHHHDPHKHN